MSLAIVTGAPGWLGTRLVDTLLNGLSEAPLVSAPLFTQVRVLALPDADISDLKPFGSAVEIVHGDLKDGSGVPKLFSNAEGATIFHVAGIIHPTGGVKELYQVNENGTQTMMDAALRVNAKRFIHVSSNSPIGIAKAGSTIFDEKSPYNPYMNYGKSKKAGEDIVNKAHATGKIETVIIRPPWFYGPNQPARQTLFFTMVKDGKAPIVGSGNNLRSMAYIDNICQGLLLCHKVEEAKGNTYWIADKEPYSMNQVIDTIEKVLTNDFGIACQGKRMRLPDLASEVAVAIDGTLQGLGLYHQKFHVLSEMNKNIACSVAKAERELGYKPTVALEEGMRRSIDWVLKHGQTI